MMKRKRPRSLPRFDHTPISVDLIRARTSDAEKRIAEAAGRAAVALAARCMPTIWNLIRAAAYEAERSLTISADLLDIEPRQFPRIAPLIRKELENQRFEVETTDDDVEYEGDDELQCLVARWPEPKPKKLKKKSRPARYADDDPEQ